MPFIINMVRRWALAAVVIPLAGKLLGVVSRKVKASRGENGLTSALDKASSAVTARGRRKK
ncbi:hypothetical protein [uncultured Pseudokineococcus sp.]|uniref:hypothetical protein n=1 Tax=uncultured Pseudokineococcus sp. TaxID=1642928 RepID=UPI00261E2077|nr:hypothetical protein [uncultured Pseudokineococcus sp.]